MRLRLAGSGRRLDVLISSLLFVLAAWDEANAERTNAGRSSAGVTLAQVIELARKRAPAIAAARARILQAEGRRFLGAVPTDPQVRLEIGRGEPRGGGPSARETGVELDQFLPSPRSVVARVRSGAAGVEAFQTEAQVVEAAHPTMNTLADGSAEKIRGCWIHTLLTRERWIEIGRVGSRPQWEVSG